MHGVSFHCSQGHPVLSVAIPANDVFCVYPCQICVVDHCVFGHDPAHGLPGADPDHLDICAPFLIYSPGALRDISSSLTGGLAIVRSWEW